MITTIFDLAVHCGAAAATPESIGRRLYKDTACGIGFSYHESRKVAAKAVRTVTVTFTKSVVGWRVLEWRVKGRKREALPLPPSLGIYLGCETGTVEYNPSTVESPEIISRWQRGNCVKITLFYQIETGGARVVPAYILVSGYCEGTDRECPSHELSFPFSEADFDAAVKQADTDGCETWNETHGCETCAERLGVDLETEESPIDFDCPTCKGDGVCL